jgi:DNA-binding NtrC family response regulator
VKAGASDYLTYAVDPVEVRHVIETIRKDIRLYSELKFLRNRIWDHESTAALKTQSPAMKAVFEKIRTVAPTDSTVLITGETGVGKGVMANLLHRHSRRSNKQFISVHCGAIPDTLLESELFGHERGAFTGAVRKKLGKFEIAQGGTLFLDEIGTISSAMQIKLLQVLQDRTFQRVGGEVTLKADVRIIVATNADLKAMVDEGAFRRDLYYRLHVFPIDIPPLRERQEDIPSLVRTFVERLNKFSLKQIENVDSEVLRVLQAYEWPGNIRELENLIERAYVLEASSILTKASFPTEFFAGEKPASTRPSSYSGMLEDVRRRAVEAAERTYLDALLKTYSGRINRTAEAAGIGVRQLHKLMTKYNLKKENYKSTD